MDDKRAAALAAVSEVEDGMRVGLGTGSTAAHAIQAIGRRVAEGLRIEAVATSLASEKLARELGIPLLDFASLDALDLTIDGADEIDPDLRAIKGAGGAMLREKIVAEASRRMVVIADGSKRVAALGGRPVPVEVLAFATTFVRARVAAMGADIALRMAGDEPWRTDQGNQILDCHFASFPDPAGLADRLAAIPGVLGHGLFVTEVDAAYISTNGEVARLERHTKS